MADKISQAVGNTESTGAELEIEGAETWTKPEIVDFKPVTVARGVSYRIGDGISNLS